MTTGRYESCPSCHARVPVEQDSQDFGPTEGHDGRHVHVDVLVCPHGHRFLDPSNTSINPDGRGI